MDNLTELQPTAYRWIILLIMWLVMLIGNYMQFQAAGLAFLLYPALHLTPAQFSMILAAPMLTSVVLGIPGGALADRFGVKQVVAAGLLLTAMAGIGRAWAGSFWAMFACAFLAGTGPALINTNGSKLLGAWFPRQQMASAMGIFISGASTGITIALATSALFPTLRNAFITAGLITLAILILWLLLVRARPAAAPAPPAQPLLQYLGVAARSRNTWLGGLAMMFYMGSYVAYSGFLPNALHQVRGISPVLAGLMASSMTLAVIAGSILIPALSDRAGRIKPFLTPVAVLASLSLYGAWNAPFGPATWSLLIVSGLLVGGTAPLLMSFPMLLPEIGPASAGSAGGIISTLQMAGAFFIPSLVITPLAGPNTNTLFALSSLSLLLHGAVMLVLPELGARAGTRPSQG